MRKLLLLCLLIITFSCEKNDTDDLLQDTDVYVTIDLNLPQYIDLQTPTGWEYTTSGMDGIEGILIINTSNNLSNPTYKAFERACPNNDCSSPMEFDGSLKLKCSCDGSEYSIIDGSPQTEGYNHFAREYNVLQIGSSTLKIINY